MTWIFILHISSRYYLSITLPSFCLNIILNLLSMSALKCKEIYVRPSIMMKILPWSLDTLTIQSPATKNAINYVGASTKYPIYWRRWFNIYFCLDRDECSIISFNWSAIWWAVSRQFKVEAFRKLLCDKFGMLLNFFFFSYFSLTEICWGFRFMKCTRSALPLVIRPGYPPIWKEMSRAASGNDIS